MLSRTVIEAAQGIGTPCFIYDLEVVRERTRVALSLVDEYLYPVKTCAEPAVLTAAVDAGAGLDLCSPGDLELAARVANAALSFTSPHATNSIARSLVEQGVTFDADSVEQALLWKANGGTRCGLRVCLTDSNSAYGEKFGVAVEGVADALDALAAQDIAFTGFHIHEGHQHRTPAEFGARLAALIDQLPPKSVEGSEYLNIGGGWPMRDGRPVHEDELRVALATIREHLARVGFRGRLVAEPGEWVVTPAGYWAAEVSAVKQHPANADRLVVVLDTATPVPCRANAAPFHLIRESREIEGLDTMCDIYGSANTGLDTIGLGIHLPRPRVGDIVVSTNQGAYSEMLISPFNERKAPGVAFI